MRTRLSEALPPARSAIPATLLWAAVCASSAFLNLAHWAAIPHVRSVVLLYGAGAALALPLAFFLARLIAGRSINQRYAAALLCLLLATIAVTAFIFALHYRSYYATWHEETFSRLWWLQLLLTMIGAFYQFAVQGLRLYLPYGLIVAFPLAYWMATRR